MIVLNNTIGIAILVALFMVIIVAAEFWGRWKNPNPEYIRKVVHFSGGLSSLLFPFLIKSPWIVFGMATALAGILWIGEKGEYLKCLTSVKRKGKGSVYFPLAIAGLFYISQEKLWLYVTSILILTISDSAAALVGSSYGRIRYQVGKEDVKSLEGSLIYCLITFITIQTTLLLMTDLHKTSCVLSALLISVLLTGIESISVKGLDNLFVPILACLTLLKFTTKPVSEIEFQCISMFCIFLILFIIIYTLKILTIRNSILFVFFTYANWSIGSEDWAIPVFITFIFYSIWRLITPNVNYHEIETRALVRALMVPVSILMLSNVFQMNKELYGPFLVSTVITFIYGSWIYLLNCKKLRGRIRLLLCILLSLIAALTVVSGTMMFQEDVPLESLFYITTLALVFTVLYDRLIGDSCLKEDVPVWAGPIWRFEVMAAGIYYCLQHYGFIGVWHPKF